MHPQEETIFNSARRYQDRAEREAFLKEACENDPDLRRRVENLLHANERAREFFGQAEGVGQASLASGNPTEILSIGEKPGEQLGRYKLLQQIGEGGCGVVYMAEQEKPVRRRVALKVIKQGMDTKAVIGRFEAERQALALMDHPNIAKVFDAGTTGSGRPYFVMELVRGTKITQYCDEQKLTTRERLELFEQVCRAVQHAHQKGIIHRDLKPSNILVTVNDGQAVPKVIDFGIAKATGERLTDKSLFTAFEQFIGTPAYMSPEQVSMTSVDIDTRSDIYSLGVLLYELLTGKTPFKTEELLERGLDEMRRIIREQEPPRPSTRLRTMLEGERTATAHRQRTEVPQLIHLLRGDLDCMVLKCLEKDRARRYETANGLAADIQRYLNDQPITARPPSTAYRLRKFVVRHKAGVAAGAVVAVTLVVGTVVSTWQAVVATEAKRKAEHSEQNEAQQREAAEAARDRAARAEIQALENLYVANLNLVQRNYEEGNLSPIRRLLGESQNDRGYEWYYWQRRIHLDLKTLRSDTIRIGGVAISPDNRFLATSTASDQGGHTRLWDATTGQEVRGFPSGGYAVAFSPDGKKLAFGQSNMVVIWDVFNQRELQRLPDTNLLSVSAVAFSPDGRTLAMAGYPQQTVWDIASGSLRFRLSDTNLGTILKIAFSPDGQKIATCGYDGVARLWEAKSGVLVPPRLASNAGHISDLSFSPKGDLLVTAHWDGRARVWSTISGELVRTIAGHTQPLQCAQFSPDGSRIYTAGWDQQIKCWDAESFRELAPLPNGHRSGILTMAVSKDGRWIFTGSWDAEAKLWDTARVDEPETIPVALWPEDRTTLSRFWGVLRGPRPMLAADCRSGRILARDTNNAVRVWDFAARRELFRLQEVHSAPVSAFSLSPDQERILTGDENGKVQVWSGLDGRKLFHLEGHTNMVRTLGFTTDSTRIFSASMDGRVILRNARGEELLRWQLFSNLHATAISPDGKHIAAGGDGGWQVLNTQNGEISEIIPQKSGVMSLAWSPDGRLLAVGCFASEASLYEIPSRKLLAGYGGHRMPVWALAFSPDGKRLVTGSMDRTAKLWELKSGRELLTLRGHLEDVHSILFSSDSTRIVTASDDQSIKIWEAATPDQVARWEKEEGESLSNIPAAFPQP